VVSTERRRYRLIDGFVHSGSVSVIAGPATTGQRHEELFCMAEAKTTAKEEIRTSEDQKFLRLGYNVWKTRAKKLNPE
jgi:hypothetical protein